MPKSALMVDSIDLSVTLLELTHWIENILKVKLGFAIDRLWLST
jgi:hypothetical protein